MSQLKNQLSKIIPKLIKEASKIRDEEVRSRWMRLRKITESSKSLSQACRFYGMSEDCYRKWGKRLIARHRIESLFTRSRRPKRSPNKTKRRIEKKVIALRRFDPSLGPDRISYDLKVLYNLVVPESTVYAILKRAQLVSRKLAQRLTKKHMKRYRRSLPGYLQMDFKYVPYLIDGKQYYQLSCVDHHSSWRLIRTYRNKNIDAVLDFLEELELVCPFPIVEIQTDNDLAFTDKFASHGLGVTGQHDLDIWCKKLKINHKLIPVGVKELNGKVENTHKQDDREFYARGKHKSFESLCLNIKGYNYRWNEQRRTKALGRKTPIEVLRTAYVKIFAFFLPHRTEENKAVYNIDLEGNSYVPLPKTAVLKKKNRTPKRSLVQRYLDYLEWEDKNKLKALAWTPTMSQSFSEFYKHMMVISIKQCVYKAGTMAAYKL